VAGGKGFGGGFAGKCGHAFGEREMKAFIHHTEEVAERLRTALLGLTADVRIALTHYSPSADTLRGEPPEIFPFLGSYLLAEAIDDSGADLAVHGHAHYGTESGTTSGGVRVRNVAQPVIQAAYRVYTLEPAAGGPRR
jgi:Icc-related predicted phosphoesterase